MYVQAGYGRVNTQDAVVCQSEHQQDTLQCSRPLQACSQALDVGARSPDTAQVVFQTAEPHLGFTPRVVEHRAHDATTAGSRP
jgi:hypothetical protein